MAIKPHAPEPGPSEFNYRHGDDFVGPVHVIKEEPLIRIDQSLVPADPDDPDRPDDPVDASYDPDEILATTPAPAVRPIFIGLRRAMANRQIERSNARLQELARKQRVVKYIGEAILSNRLYNDAKVDKQPNLNRPSSREEIRAAEKLDKIAARRREVGAYAHAKSHSLTTPVSARRAEKRHAQQSGKRHDKAHRKLVRLDKRFRRAVSQPAREATRVTARRNRAVARREALDRVAQ